MRRREFQSHAGSIEALKISYSIPKSDSCFNPTLVRLRPVWRLRLKKFIIVSIPRWFD